MKMASKPKELIRSAILWPLRLVIRAYQVGISPLLPSSCRYYPTCSHYAAEALEVHGPLRGSIMAARRILRCHPFERLGGGSGFDPVPHPTHKTNQIEDSPCDHGPTHHFPLVRD